MNVPQISNQIVVKSMDEAQALNLPYPVEEKNAWAMNEPLTLWWLKFGDS